MKSLSAQQFLWHLWAIPPTNQRPKHLPHWPLLSIHPLPKPRLPASVVQPPTTRSLDCGGHPYARYTKGKGGQVPRSCHLWEKTVFFLFASLLPCPCLTLSISLSFKLPLLLPHPLLSLYLLFSLLSSVLLAPPHAGSAHCLSSVPCSCF